MAEPDRLPSGNGDAPTAFTAAVSAITDAFGDPTRRRIYLFTRDGSGVALPFSADEHNAGLRLVEQVCLVCCSRTNRDRVGHARRSGASRPTWAPDSRHPTPPTG